MPGPKTILRRAKPRGHASALLGLLAGLALAWPALATVNPPFSTFEIAGTKNRIAVERMRYNALVGHFNTKIKQLPWSLVAGNFEPRSYYDAPDEKLSEPVLDI